MSGYIKDMIELNIYKSIFLKIFLSRISLFVVSQKDNVKIECVDFEQYSALLQMRYIAKSNKESLWKLCSRK